VDKKCIKKEYQKVNFNKNELILLKCADIDMAHIKCFILNIYDKLTI